MTSETQAGRLAMLTKPVMTALGPMSAAPSKSLALLHQRVAAGDQDKRHPDLSSVFDRFAIEDGMTLSFHHHYRNGDRMMNAVLAEAARRGLRGLTIAPSSLFPVHAPLAEYVRSGVIGAIVTDYAKGPVADAMMSGALALMPVLQSHGGRARALSTGALCVDVAFVGASLALPDGSCTGRAGAVPCGPLGYAMVDAAYASRTVVCAHALATAPLSHTDIRADHVDAVVHFPRPGDVGGIESDTTLAAQTPQAQQIGALVARVIGAAGLLKSGMSLQTGAGGFSLSAAATVGEAMATAGVRGSFVSGGITGTHVALQRAGVFERIHDVQCFDEAAVHSSINNPDHFAMSASEYANPLHPTPAIVEGLSVMILGAVEIDRQFNVNVTIGGNGKLIGGPGGHPDAAQGADLTIVTTGLTAGGYAKLTEHARCVTTQGDGIDVLVTDSGIAINPKRADLTADLSGAGLPVVSFDQLLDASQRAAAKPRTPSQPSPRILVEHRTGGILDWG